MYTENMKKEKNQINNVEKKCKNVATTPFGMCSMSQKEVTLTSFLSIFLEFILIMQ